MKIYPLEQKFQDKILAADHFFCTLDCIYNVDKQDEFISYLENEIEAKDKKSVAALEKLISKPSPMLMYGSAILGSVGINGNDDIFLPTELVKSYKTIVHQPLNLEHKSKKIVGHIFASRLIDDEYEEFTAKKDEELPDMFHIETSFAVYKSIFPKTAAKIEKDYNEGNAFVSLEGKINDFDYGLIEGNKVSIVPRNESTSGLTQYLRVFGGEGTFNGKKIGRVLKNIVFRGMGVVSIPANKHSEFTNLVNASLEIDQETGKYANEIISSVLLSRKQTFVVRERFLEMPKEIKTLEEAKEALLELQAKNEELEEMLSAGKTEKLTQDLEEAKASNKTLSDKVTALEAQLEVVTSDRDAKANELTETSARFETVNTELSTIKAEKRNAERYSKLEQLGIKLDDERRTKFAAMEDAAFEMFAEQMEDYVKAHPASAATETETDTDETPDTLETEAGETAGESEVETEVQASLDNKVHNAASTLVAVLRSNKR